MTTTQDSAGDVGVVALTARDFKGAVDPDWCPGCGDFGVLNSLQRACAGLGLQPHQILTVSGIGCSSNLPGYFNSYGMHTLHGRSLAVATGAKLANPRVDRHRYRRRRGRLRHRRQPLHPYRPVATLTLTYIVMNNQIYGLTTGQISPHQPGRDENQEHPLRQRGNAHQPHHLGHYERGDLCGPGPTYSGDVRHLTDLMQQAIKHKGFALVDVFSPCVTFNLDNTHNFFKGPGWSSWRMREHDTGDWKLACEKAMAWGDTIYTGVFFPDSRHAPAWAAAEPVLDEGGPLAFRPPGA